MRPSRLWVLLFFNEINGSLEPHLFLGRGRRSRSASAGHACVYLALIGAEEKSDRYKVRPSLSSTHFRHSIPRIIGFTRRQIESLSE
jgi:hypothetical protein